MGWRQELELELELTVADALAGGPASEAGCRLAERNMRAVLDRWLASGRMPGVKAYHLQVSGGAGLTVDLRFEEHDRVKEVNVDVGKVS